MILLKFFQLSVFIVSALTMGRFRDPEFLNRVFLWVNSILDIIEIIQKTAIGNQIRYQLVKSSTSVGANLEEADAAISRKEFISFVNIVKREAKESHYWLRILKYRKMLDMRMLNPILDETDEIIKILFSIAKGSRNDQE